MKNTNTVQRCPTCDGIGKPVLVKAEAGETVVQYRCPYCRQTWTVKQPKDAA